MPQNGYYFVRWILNAFYTIVDVFSGVWSWFTTPLVFPDKILGIPIDLSIEIIPLDVMFFGGITFYLTFIVIKFVLDIVLQRGQAFFPVVFQGAAGFSRGSLEHYLFEVFMINFIICLCFCILLSLLSICFVIACVYFAILEPDISLSLYFVTAVLCVVTIVLFSNTIDLYHTRCPTCDVICLDDYCSTCGFCMNPFIECSCGSSYDLDSLPNFCSECGSPLK